jgi:asparagine synthase (glutamine-hydrolysing)
VCGIVGWFAPGGKKPDRRVLARMTATLSHRGPDADGLHIEPGVGFGHRRLSIVDLGGGAQPMRSEDGRVAVTFNGEIYNHPSLRRDLEQRGATFRTSSDTESLIHGFRNWGADLPCHLNGMFAFGIWDADNRRGLLARDRLGEKPLYYAHLADGTLLFASEPKALLEHPSIERKLDPEAIALYLTYEYIPWPHSAFRGIRKLGPGQRIVWDNGKIALDSYWVPPFGEPTAIRSPREYIAEVRAALARSVKARLMSDVPLGVFLSGGVDSSAIVALMAEHVPGPEIRTFSIAFEDSTFDESRWARIVADQFGTDHRVQTFSASTMLETLPEITRLMDEPFGDASLLPTYLLSKFTREHVKVALGGDGGDELFMGYETFRADTAAGIYRRLPAPLRALVSAGVQKLPVDTGNFSLDFILKSFVRGADAAPEFRHVRWLSSFIPNTPDDALSRDLRDQVPDSRVFGVMADPYIECRDADHRQRLSYAYIRTYLAEDILTKVDRASMATSLETRPPFLDPELVSLVARMPANLKLHAGFNAKYALKKALADDLPHEILHRKKKGFGVPVARWLNGPLASELDRLLEPSRVRAAGILDANVVSRLIAEHRSGQRDNRKQLWTLMMLEYWRERYNVSA